MTTCRVQRLPPDLTLHRFFSFNAAILVGMSADWDVFVSYNQADRAWAKWIAWQLEHAGLEVLIEAWDFVPGSNWTHVMQEGVQRAERTLAVLSRSYLTSVYGTAEWEVAWAADPLGLKRKLLVVRVEDCDRPGFLGQVVGIDLFGVTRDEARTTLVNGVAAALAGRAKPVSEPPFPGA
ncbi:toll/interleukin-1 receptor domain-containing protein [Lentzea sp. NPDC004789]